MFWAERRQLVVSMLQECMPFDGKWFLKYNNIFFDNTFSLAHLFLGCLFWVFVLFVVLFYFFTNLFFGINIFFFQILVVFLLVLSITSFRRPSFAKKHGRIVIPLVSAPWSQGRRPGIGRESGSGVKDMVSVFPCGLPIVYLRFSRDLIKFVNIDYIRHMKSKNCVHFQWDSVI